ncbi:MAG: hypothetical protein PHS82_14620 [Lachnospiraceae bacterium]|nr:hypothetical protein [Lachnospiraceae bacterium]
MEADITMSEKDLLKRVKKAVSLDLEKRKAMNAPIVRYDRETGDIYHEMPDGEMVKVSSGRKRGRYSERIKEKA